MVSPVLLSLPRALRSSMFSTFAQSGCVRHRLPQGSAATRTEALPKRSNRSYRPQPDGRRGSIEDDDKPAAGVANTAAVLASEVCDRLKVGGETPLNRRGDGLHGERHQAARYRPEETTGCAPRQSHRSGSRRLMRRGRVASRGRLADGSNTAQAVASQTRLTDSLLAQGGRLPARPVGARRLSSFA